MQIFVVAYWPGQEDFFQGTINVEASDTVADLKEKIRKKYGVPLKEQHLFFQGDELQDGQVISGYNINNESSLGDGLQDPLVLDNTLMMPETRKMLLRPDTLPGGKKREDGWTGRMIMSKGPDCEMTPACIYIKTLHGKTLMFPIDDFNGMATPMLEVKGWIFKTKGIPIEKQKLIFNGKSLEDDKSFNDYGMEVVCTMHLVACN